MTLQYLVKKKKKKKEGEKTKIKINKWGEINQPKILSNFQPSFYQPTHSGFC